MRFGVGRERNPNSEAVRGFMWVPQMDEDVIDEILAGMGYEEDDDLDELEGEVSDIELAGYGEQIVGAPFRRRRRRSPGRRALVRKVKNTELRRYPLGLGVTNIAAGATVIIRANPQLPFKVERIITPTTGMTIDNIQVGTVSQFVAAGAVPTEVFQPDAVAVGLKGDTAVPGVDVAITVTNPGGLAADFSGALIGLVAQ